MKNKYLLSLLWVIVSGFGILMAQEIAIIPQPAHLIVKNESFKFGKQLKVCIASYRGDSVTLVFDSFKDDFQKATGIKVTSVHSEAKAGIKRLHRRLISWMFRQNRFVLKLRALPGFIMHFKH
jgi:hexosaminidase